MATTPAAPLPAGWEQYIDPASGVIYFHDFCSGCSQWERPVMASSREQHRTGIASFDIDGLLRPMAECISELQHDIDTANVSMLKDMRRDPVPQFTNKQIRDSTDFLAAAIEAMQGFVDEFKPASVKDMDDDELASHLERARESARRLVLLFGDARSNFSGSSMKGSLIAFHERSQPNEIRDRLSSLQSLLKTFGQAAWLGHVLADTEFCAKTSTAIGVLDGLLRPGTFILPKARAQKMLRVVRQELEVLSCRMRSLQRDARNQPARAQEAQDVQNRIQDLQALQYELPWGGDPRGVPFYGGPSALPSPLEEIRKTCSGGSKLECLSQMCRKLAEIFEEDSRKRADMQQDINTKMSMLKDFAKTLNLVPEVLKQYLLVRLGDVDVADSSELKNWVTHDEATRVHKMLEAFRDEAVQERAVRQITARVGSDGVSSMKEYLFVKSAGAAAAGSMDSLQNDSADYVSVAEEEPQTASPRKGKSSHRTRARKAKFWASVPRTPSSGTHQS